MKQLFTLAFILFCVVSFAQQKKNLIKKEVQTIYYYSYSGVKDQAQIDKVESEISTLKYVSGVKTKYKVEKQAAQSIITVTTIESTSEERQDFDLGAVKAILINNNLTPGNLKIGENNTK